MDPNATWKIIGSGADLDERAQAALDLLVWLARDGFAPDGVTRTRAVHDCELVLSRMLDAES